MVRDLRTSSRFSRAICLACLSVGLRIDQLSWPKMLVLMAIAQVSTRWTCMCRNALVHTVYTIGTENVCPLDPPTC